MTIAQRGIAVLIGLALATAASAQDQDDAAPEAGAEAAAPATEAAPAEETGETEAPAAEDGVREVYIAEEFGDWQFSCIRTGTGNDPCRFTQTLENGEGGRVAQVTVVPLPPGEPVAAAAVVETPLGTLLRVPRDADELSQPGGLRIRVDDGELRVFQFTFCNSGGCVAEIGMEDDFVNAFKRGAVATITIWSADAPGQPVELPLSLTGFTAGFDRVAELAGGGEE
ncbi:MAG: invasion associated locus B family protein [Paracoccaceae bacterium]|nr:invasion associated locus B family protein [Paracoccaceae bacterium]